MSDLRPFHLAIPVRDIASTRKFYAGILGCTVGRSTAAWIDFNFYGHQLTAHVKPEELSRVSTNIVDNAEVPIRHFGIVLEWNDWQVLSRKLADAGVGFLIRPTIRFQGLAGEQATLFITDPSGNILEFKSFREDHRLFAVD